MRHYYKTWFKSELRPQKSCGPVTGLPGLNIDFWYMWYINQKLKKIEVETKLFIFFCTFYPIVPSHKITHSYHTHTHMKTILFLGCFQKACVCVCGLCVCVCVCVFVCTLLGKKYRRIWIISAVFIFMFMY